MLEHRRFTARSVIDVPAGGVRSASRHVVDLDRALARVSTTITMTPVAGASTSWTPQDGTPVVHWVVGDHLLMQLPDQDGSSQWVSVPDSPLLSSELSLLLWPAGVIEILAPRGSSAAISAVVDLGVVIDRAPAIHARAAAQFIAEMAPSTGGQVVVELTLTDGALSQIDVELVDDVEAEPTRRVVHLAVEPEVPAPLADPPHPQEAFEVGELERWVEEYVSGGPQWWTKTRPFRA